MKNKAVELMVRYHFDIDPDIGIKVEFVSSINEYFTFNVEWYEDGQRFYTTIELPHIRLFSEKLKDDLDVES